MDPFTEIGLGEEERLLRDSVSEFAANEISPRSEAMDMDPSGSELREVLAGSAELGLTAALLPEGAGGSGLDPLSFCLALEEVAAGSAGVAALLLAHNLALYGLSLGGEETDYLEGNGETWALLASDEMTIGGKGGDVELDGTDGFVPNAGSARGFVVAVRGVSGAGLYMVEPGSPGLSVEPHVMQMGLRAARWGSVSLQGTPCTALDAGAEEPVWLLSMARVGMAAIASGIARTAYVGALEYARQRYQAGAQIVEHQEMRMLMSQIISAAETSRSLVRFACAGGDRPPDAGAALVAKIVSTDAVMEGASNAVQIHGGYGYMKEYGMERLMRDAKYCHLYPEGNPEAHLELFSLKSEMTSAGDGGVVGSMCPIK